MNLALHTPTFLAEECRILTFLPCKIWFQVSDGGTGGKAADAEAEADADDEFAERSEKDRKAGLPDGLVNFVPSDGPTFGKVVTGHKELAAINFTGSVPWVVITKFRYIYGGVIFFKLDKEPH